MKGQTKSSLLLVLLLSSVSYLNAGECTPGKCANCGLDTDGSPKCLMCLNSRLSADGACEGNDSGLDNCRLSAVVGSSISCSQGGCNPGYHYDSTAMSCYQGTVDPNCYSESKFLDPLNGDQETITCSSCNNGYYIQNSGVGADACVESPGSEINNCATMTLETACTFCDVDYYSNPDGTECLERTTLIQKACYSATSSEGEDDDGNPYCEQCNILAGYYAISAKELAAGGTVQACQKWSSILRLGICLLAFSIWVV